MDQSFSYSTPYNIDLTTLNKDALNLYIKRCIKLPNNSRLVLFGSATANYIVDVIGNQFELTSEQTDCVTRIIRDAILGDIDMQDTPTALMDSCGLPPETAGRLAQKIVDDLFTPIVGEIIKTREENLNTANNTRVVPPPVIPGQQVNPNNIIDLRQQNK